MAKMNFWGSFAPASEKMQSACAASKAASARYESRIAFNEKLEAIIASEEARKAAKAAKRVLLKEGERECLKKADVNVYKTFNAFKRDEAIARRAARKEWFDEVFSYIREARAAAREIVASTIADLMWARFYDALVEGQITEFGQLKRELIDLKVTLFEWAEEMPTVEERRGYREIAKWVDKTYLCDNKEIRKLRKELLENLR